MKWYFNREGKKKGARRTRELTPNRSRNFRQRGQRIHATNKRSGPQPPMQTVGNEMHAE